MQAVHRISGGVVSERHLYAYGLPIREESRSAGWLSALATRIEQLLSMRPKRPTTPSHCVIHVWLPTGESIDGPTVLYVDPELERLRLPAVADS